mmetsp:Transcript_87720/g.246447  ORF Transcript_87720/g.246447 Transcript_87720/m.246447 type:complete len:404 (+) Transcript_87720:125-1336(+)
MTQCTSLGQLGRRLQNRRALLSQKIRGASLSTASPDARQQCVSERDLQLKLEGCVSAAAVLQVLRCPPGGLPLADWPSASITTAWHRLAKASQGEILDGQDVPGGAGDSDVAMRLLSDALPDSCEFQRFKPRQLSNLLWAWSRLRFRRGPLLRTLCERILGYDAARFAPQGIANILYAAGLLRLRHRTLVWVLCGNAQSRLSEFSTQGVGNCAYGMALLGMRHRPLLTAICEHVPTRISDFAPQELANLMYACGLLTFRHSGFIGAFGENVPGRLACFTAQNLSNIVYALGLLDACFEDLLQAVCDHACGRLGEFTAQGLSNTLYGLGLLGFRHVALLASLRRHLPGRVHELIPLNLANVAFGLQASWCLGCWRTRLPHSSKQSHRNAHGQRLRIRERARPHV